MIRMIFLLLGCAISLLGLGVTAVDLFRPDVPWQRLGQFWFTYAPTGLQLAESIVSRYIDPCGAIPALGCAPFLWHPVISTVLTWYAAPCFLGLGLIMMALGARKRRS